MLLLQMLSVYDEIMKGLLINEFLECVENGEIVDEATCGCIPVSNLTHFF